MKYNICRDRTIYELSIYIYENIILIMIMIIIFVIIISVIKWDYKEIILVSD
jgi:hypothetical protein